MQTISAITKSVSVISNQIETELIVFNGVLLEIAFVRAWSATFGSSIQVKNHITGEVLATHPWTGAMGCAIVSPDNKLHIYGNTNWASNGNKIIHSILDQITYAPSMPTDALLVNSPFKFYNTSICSDSNGYRMVVETTAGTFFARSTDLNSWSYYGGQLTAGQYVGCPTIDFINGAHYITYLKEVSGKHITQVAKSTDNCFSFTYFSGNAINPSGTCLLAPTLEEATNNSDASFVEFDGKVYGCYLDGDQVTYANFKKFTYNGTLPQLFNEFFEVGNVTNPPTVTYAATAAYIGSDGFFYIGEGILRKRIQVI